MKNIILKIVSLIFLFLISILIFLSVKGIETTRLNNQISQQIENINKDLKIELNKVNIILDPFAFKIKAKTIGPQIENNKKIIKLESIETNVSINSFLKNEFSLADLKISTKSLEIKNLISFLRLFKNSPELYVFEKIVKNGYLIANINLEFDENGKVKDNYNVKGIIKDAKINILKKYDIKKINLSFNIEDNEYDFSNILFTLNEIPFSSNSISVKNFDKDLLIKGDFKSKNILINSDNFKSFFDKDSLKFNFDTLNFESENNFSFRLNKKFKIKNLKISSNLILKKLVLLNEANLKSIFPKIKEKINFSNHSIKVIYEDSKLLVNGKGPVQIQNESDEIKYSIERNKDNLKLIVKLEIEDNPLFVEFLNYEKKDKSKAIIDLNADFIFDKEIRLNSFSFKEKKNFLKIENLFLDKNFNFLSFKKVNLNYTDKDEKKNSFIISKKNKNYLLKGKSFNGEFLIDSFINDDSEEKSEFFNKNIDLEIKLDEVFLDNETKIKNFSGNINLKNNEILFANLSAFFSNNEKLIFTINSTNNEKVTTFFLDRGESIVKRYKFIKGFEDGVLDFYSLKKNDKSISTLKIYDFKLKEVPVLTKILTLASLQGIADILSGEGIRFDEFEMNFTNEDNLMTINEIYAIGPAISILMDGYVEKNKLISLRGTLVPATTINKFIGSLPVLGKILVGSKTGEGVFGVSFKIKGPPKNLETSVNPIKTLTPRFITRTLEKIKKN